jgi:molecular chaperone DnaK
MEELKDKLTAEMHNRLETEIRKVEDALATNDTEKIKSATEGLTKVWNEIAPTLYQQGPQPGSPQQGEPSTGEPHDGKQQQSSSEKKDDRDVQDASYEVVDDDKK